MPWVNNPSAWVRAVKKRDGTCFQCDQTEKLIAHHIFPRSDLPQLSLLLANGVTLCRECHKRYYRPGRGVGYRFYREKLRALLRIIFALGASVGANQTVRPPGYHEKDSSPSLTIIGRCLYDADGQYIGQFRLTRYGGGREKVIFTSQQPIVSIARH